MEKYKKAVLDVDRFQEKCLIDGKIKEFLRQKEIIDFADSLEIIDGKQTLLVFTLLPNNLQPRSDNFKMEAIITIDSSHKAILAIEARHYKMTEVNHGDLENPNLSRELVLYGTAKCKNLEQSNSENN